MSTVVDVPVIQGSNLKAQIEIPETLQVVQDAKPPRGYGMFRILNSKDGDKRVVWNSDVLAEIRDAKKMFDDLVASGLVPYKVGDRGQRTPEIMKQFDPTAEEIIFAPIHLARGG
ncbi:MAG: hypothetical protein M0R80_07970 [Proteobacteria bacterium]|jgi:hypothetical protein|nr:hypothetical protein [Pseudomonadota bacterium]